MLKATLQDFWDADKFATSWIIGTKKPEETLQHIKEFAQNIINVAGLPIDNNPDFRIVKREDTKYIAVDQIRDLQQFLNTTSTVGEYKFAVIYEAELMNNNSANCCLKILEEPPRQSYLFLITSEPANLSATIKSRCHKLHIACQSQDTLKTDPIEFMQAMLGMNITQKTKWLQEISSKSKLAVWEEFCQNSIDFMANNVNNYKTMKQFEEIQKMIQDTSDFDLDKRHMGILILYVIARSTQCDAAIPLCGMRLPRRYAPPNDG